MIEAIKKQAERRGVTRLCHFTPSRNLIHIASGATGVLATKKLSQSERHVYTPTDLERLDGHPDHICCSIEFPNAWYFEKARNQDVLFTDWVVILVRPTYLWHNGTRFSPRNASAGRGHRIAAGEFAFSLLYADEVTGAYGNVFRRMPNHLPCCPTDDQAEVLIPDHIILDDILAIAVRDETQAKAELAAFRLAGVPENRFGFVISPTFFDKRELSKCIRSGQYPPERVWYPQGCDHD
jgi:hypothetical protein